MGVFGGVSEAAGLHCGGRAARLCCAAQRATAKRTGASGRGRPALPLPAPPLPVLPWCVLPSSGAASCVAWMNPSLSYLGGKYSPAACAASHADCWTT